MTKRRYNRCMEYSDQLRANIQRLIDEDVVSVIEIAAMAGLGRQTVYDFLSRKIKDLGAGKIAMLSDGLKLSTDALLKTDVKIPAKSA